MTASSKFLAVIVSVYICSAVAANNQGYGMSTSQDDKNYAVCPSYTIDCTIQDVCCPIGTYCFGGAFQGICCPTSTLPFNFPISLMPIRSKRFLHCWKLLTNASQTRTAQLPLWPSPPAPTPLGNSTMRAIHQLPRSE